MFACFHLASKVGPHDKPEPVHGRPCQSFSTSSVRTFPNPLGREPRDRLVHAHEIIGYFPSGFCVLEDILSYHALRRIFTKSSRKKSTLSDHARREGKVEIACPHQTCFPVSSCSVHAFPSSTWVRNQRAGSAKYAPLPCMHQVTSSGRTQRYTDGGNKQTRCLSFLFTKETRCNIIAVLLGNSA